MFSHRYWRLKWDASPRGFCSCSQLQLRDTVGGPDLTQGAGSPLAGTSSGGFPASNAFNNNPSNFWSSVGAADYIGWDFGAGRAFDIVEFVYAPRNDAFSDGDGPRPGGLEYSDNGSTWTRVFTLTPPTTYDSGSTYLFDGPSPAAGLEVSRLSEYVTEGPLNDDVVVSRLSLAVVEGPPVQLYTSRLSLYVVEGPPVLPAHRLGPSVF